MSQMPTNNPAPFAGGIDGRGGVRAAGATGSAVGSEAPIPGDLTDRFKEVIRMIPDHLPGEMAEQFRQMLTVEALGIMALVLAAWAGSHAVGVGFAFDAGLLIVGVIMLGASMVEVVRLIGEGASITAGATSRADLDAAARKFALACAIIGVQAFLALLLKKVGSAKPASASARPRMVPELHPPKPPTAAAIAASRGATIADDVVRMYARAMGRTGAKGATFENMRTALDYFARYYESVGKNAANGTVDPKVLEYLGGIDMKNPVRIVTLKQGDELVQWTAGGPGQWFTIRGGTPADVAVSGAGRTPKRYKVMQDVEVLESRAAGTADVWTSGRRADVVVPKRESVIASEKSGAIESTKLGPGYAPGGPTPEQIPKARWGEFASGGGVQYFIPAKVHGKLLGWLPPPNVRAAQKTVAKARMEQR